MLKRKTSCKKLTQAIVKTDGWIKHNRHKKVKELIFALNLKLRGHYNYYGITFNFKSINNDYEEVKRSLHKWLNRRGGKTFWTWARFRKLFEEWMPMFKPKLYHSYQTAKPV